MTSNEQHRLAEQRRLAVRELVLALLACMLALMTLVLVSR